LRDRLRDGLAARIERLRVNGSWASRLPHNLHVCIDGVSSESLVLGLDQAGIAAGLGSACNSKAMRPSHVLKAMGLTDEQAAGALVLTVGECTTDEEMTKALEIIPQVVEKLRRVTALTSR
jgi:cysteine desulfurase